MNETANGYWCDLFWIGMKRTSVRLLLPPVKGLNIMLGDYLFVIDKVTEIVGTNDNFQLSVSPDPAGGRFDHTKLFSEGWVENGPRH